MSDQRTQVLIPTLKAGTYAVSTVNHVTWLNTSVNPTPNKVRKSKGTTKPINEIFAECAKLTTDPYWLSIFNQAAIGKMPKKFSYSNGNLSYKRATKIQSVEVPQSPIEAISVCINFFRHYGGLASELEQKSISNNAATNSCSLADVPQTWAKTRKKMKEVMVENFVRSLAQSMKLTKVEAKQLHLLINFGLVLKIFHKDNISVGRNKILKIEGLCYNPENRQFYSDPNLVPKVSRSRTAEVSTELKETSVSFAKQWYKLLEGIEKEVAKANETKMRILNPQPSIKEDDGDQDTSI